jgi:hypothetical protein
MPVLSASKRLALLACIGGVAIATALVPSASGHHEGVLCDYVGNRGISQNDVQWPLPFRWLNWTYWDSNRDYIGLRKDGQGNLTFRQLFPPSPPSARTTTPSGYDEFRTSGIQRAGYTFATYSIRQWSHDGCASR